MNIFSQSASQINSQNRNSGSSFESLLQSMFDYQHSKGTMYIQKTPEPMRCIKNMDNGKFMAVYGSKSQPDFKGCTKDGICLIVEAKHTSSDRILLSCIDSAKNDEKKYLDNYMAMKSICYMAVQFGYSNPCMIPYDVFSGMKEIYGRKYMLKEECNKYLWDGYSGTAFYERTYA